MNGNIKLSSPRTRKARMALLLRNKYLDLALLVAIILSLAGGAFLFYVGSSLAYLAWWPAATSIVVRIWNRGELSFLDKNIDVGTVEGSLDSEILARVKSNDPSAYEIWHAASDTEARWFFQNRYLISPDLFEAIPKEPGTAKALWSKAIELAQQHNLHKLDQSVIYVALLKMVPNIDQILATAKLDFEDIEQGIDWLNNIEEKRRLAREIKQFGGIARDWAYGYTPILNYLGSNVSDQIKYGGFFADRSLNDDLTDQMIQNLASGSGSVSLVGDTGVGKTTAVMAFANKLLTEEGIPEGLKNHQVISLNAPTLLSQARNRGELEGLMIRVFNEAARAKNIILFLDDAEVFFEQGEASVDLSNIILPVLDNGSVRLIFAMTPKQWQTLSTHSSNVASKFHPIQLKPADEASTMHLLRDQIIFVEAQKGVIYTHQSLKEAYKLGSRYDDTQSMPGAALSLLRAAAPMADGGLVTLEVVQKAIESSVGVKLTSAQGDESSKLLNLESDLARYVISQKQAIDAVANSLRRARSGVGNPDRPVGTFLFLGPTGVGKTELSKALARVYFGDEKSMIRVDMNQFVNPEDSERLLMPMIGEQLGFLGEVRKKPFSVILFDEIEKADKSVINLLLQMLDEGVMTDSNNKQVSFKDAIIIATSNAGADQIRSMIDQGEDVSSLQNKLVDIVIERGIFTPEFVNRFDEVVVFKPLTPQELVQVVDLIIAGINKTLEAQKVKVEVSDDAKKWLVEKGYDAKLGARPMRRAAQKYVENILAKKLLDKSLLSGGSVKLEVSDFENLDSTS